MVFSSLNFIFIFLPIFLLFYSMAPVRWKNLILFLTSIFFYGYGVKEHPSYLLIFILSIVINYILALGIWSFQYEKKADIALWIGIIYNMGILFAFKYANFFITQIGLWIDIPQDIRNLTIFNLSLPIGISFYTFQAMAYLVDVYRGESRPDRSLIDFGAFLSMFPQLIAGPIIQYEPVKPTLKEHRRASLYLISEGAKTFIFGLGLKVILANQMGSLWTTINNIGYESISTKLAWMGIIARSFQIYFDFFGYSVMAIGLGKMIGIHLPDNFNHPYLSRSMTEFWRRWHITLGSWFREYVYIPLGGNRGGELKTYRNLFIVWAFTGLWHGASMNFVIWGLVLFALIAIEKLFLKNILDNFAILAYIYMFFAVNISWAVFSITDFDQLSLFYTRLFPFFGHSEFATFASDYLKYGKQFGLYFVLCIFFSTTLPYTIYNRIKDTVIGGIFLIIVFGVSVYGLARGMNDPFLYFRF